MHDEDITPPPQRGELLLRGGGRCHWNFLQRQIRGRGEGVGGGGEGRILRSPPRVRPKATVSRAWCPCSDGGPEPRWVAYQAGMGFDELSTQATRGSRQLSIPVGMGGPKTGHHWKLTAYWQRPRRTAWLCEYKVPYRGEGRGSTAGFRCPTKPVASPGRARATTGVDFAGLPGFPVAGSGLDRRWVDALGFGRGVGCLRLAAVAKGHGWPCG